MPKSIEIVVDKYLAGDNVITRRLVPKIYGLGWLIGYKMENWKSLNSERNKLKVKANEAAKKLHDVLLQIEDADKHIKDQIALIKKKGTEDQGCATPRYTIEVSNKELRQDYHYEPEPPEHYKELVRPEIFSKSKGRMNIFSKMGGGIGRGHTAIFTEDTSKLKEMYNVMHAPGDGYDSVEVYREDDPKGKNQGKSKHYKNRLSGESDSDYKERIRQYEEEYGIRK